MATRLMRHQAESSGTRLINFVIGGFMRCGGDEGPEIARLHGIEEEGPVVGDGRDVENVIALVCTGMGWQQIVEVIVGVNAGEINGLHACGFHHGRGAADIAPR